MRRILLLILIGLAATACNESSLTSSARSGSSARTPIPTFSRPAAAAQACPKAGPLPRNGGTAWSIEYVDFVQFQGRQYLAMFAHPPTVTARQLGGQVGIVRCRLEGSGAPPTYRAQSGDAAFLATGTPLFALKGWPVRCRIAAKPAGARAAQVFVAERPGGRTAQPVDCGDGSD